MIGNIEQGLIVLQRNQRQIAATIGLLIPNLRLCVTPRPQPRPVIIVKHHPPAPGAQTISTLEQACSRLGRQHRQADSAEIEHIDRLEPVFERTARSVEIVFGGAGIAPVVKSAFARRIDLNRVQPGHAPGLAQHETRVNALLLPRRQHRVAIGIRPKLSGESHLDATVAAEARQINCRIQRIAAEILLHGAEHLPAQLDHALAEEHYPAFCFHDAPPCKPARRQPDRKRHKITRGNTIRPHRAMIQPKAGIQHKPA